MNQFTIKDINDFAWTWVKNNIVSVERNDQEYAFEVIKKELLRVFEAANEPLKGEII